MANIIQTSAFFTPTVPLSSLISGTSPQPPNPPTASKGILRGEGSVLRIPWTPETLVLTGTPKPVTIHWQEGPRSISRMREMKAPFNCCTNKLPSSNRGRHVSIVPSSTKSPDILHYRPCVLHPHSDGTLSKIPPAIGLGLLDIELIFLKWIVAIFISDLKEGESYYVWTGFGCSKLTSR